MTDAPEVRAFWEALGLPGLMDLHVHFLPPNIQRAVWAVFDEAGPKIGRPWPIRYRQSHEERVALLREFGVRAFPTHPYAHKPGVASYLNDWSREFAATAPDILRSATFYPEPEAASYVAEGIADGVRMFKIHLQVGEFVADDPLLDPVWGVLEDAGTPVTVHAGSGPVGNAFTGPDSVARLLRRFPRLCLVIAHMGAPEYDDFLVLAETYANVHLDTTMVFTDFFDEGGAYPAEPPAAVGGPPGRRCCSARTSRPFPTRTTTRLTGLARLDLGDDWLRDVCWHNAVRLLQTP
ncbi:amidohydrolase family protein [Nocardioides convexus]|uniref:amidohydrolase family protein n=1 Tax=Nocardioides convexus TaxID=2712224 RepID=UPI0024181F5C|nr:amidohydrolase family protein [Nocardioides convexus]